MPSNTDTSSQGDPAEPSDQAEVSVLFVEDKPPLAEYIEGAVLAPHGHHVALPLCQRVKPVGGRAYILVCYTSGLSWGSAAAMAATLLPASWPRTALGVAFQVGAYVAIGFEGGYAGTQLALKLDYKSAAEAELHSTFSRGKSSMIYFLGILSATSMVVAAYRYNPPGLNLFAAIQVALVNPSYGYWGFTEIWERMRRLLVLTFGDAQRRRQERLRLRLHQALLSEIDNPEGVYAMTSNAREYIAAILRQPLARDSLLTRVGCYGNTLVQAGAAAILGVRLTSGALRLVWDAPYFVWPITCLTESCLFAINAVAVYDRTHSLVTQATRPARSTLFSNRFGFFYNRVVDFSLACIALVAAPAAAIFVSFSLFGEDNGAALFLAVLNGLAKVMLSSYTISRQAKEHVLRADAWARGDAAASRRLERDLALRKLVHMSPRLPFSAIEPLLPESERDSHSSSERKEHYSQGFTL